MTELNELILREAGVLETDKPSLSAKKRSRKNQGGKKDNDNGAAAGNTGSPASDSNSGSAGNDSRPPVSGTLLIDATVAERQIAYPTDLNLLNEAREHLERMILRGCAMAGDRAPRMYSRIARKKYLAVAKNKRKSRAVLRKGIRQQLQYVRRNLGYINRLVERNAMFGLTLEKRDWRLLMVIHELYRQQDLMYRSREQSIADRIVNLYQPHVRPMPRGKDRVSTEFGSKQLVFLKDGYAHVCKLEWDNFNDGVYLEEALEKYRRFYGCYPARVLGDRLFGSRENRRLMKGKGICFVGKSPGRPTKDQKEREKLLHKEMAQRNAIEGKFGQGKTAYGLAKIKARLRGTSESWILSIYLVMNLVKLVQNTASSMLSSVFALLSAMANLVEHNIAQGGRRMRAIKQYSYTQQRLRIRGDFLKN